MTPINYVDYWLLCCVREARVASMDEVDEQQRLFCCDEWTSDWAGLNFV